MKDMEQNITIVTLTNLIFDTKVIFDLYGIVTFDNCILHGHFFVINLSRSHNEPKPFYKSLSNEIHNLKFIRTQFKVTSPDSVGFRITGINVIRGIHILHCNMSGYPVYNLTSAYFPIVQVFTGEESTSLDTTMVKVLIEASAVTKMWVEIICMSVFSVTIVRVSDTALHDSIITKMRSGGVAGFHLENCIFSASSESRPRGIHLYEGLYLYISKCEFSIYDIYCVQGCAVFVDGLRSFDLVISQFVSVLREHSIDQPTVIIEDSVFHGSMAKQSGGTIKCFEVSLILRNCIFEMTPYSIPPPIGGFLYYDAYNRDHQVLLTNVTLNAYQSKKPMSLVVLTYTSCQFENFTLYCPQSLKSVIRGDLFTISISCEVACPEGYTFESGNLTVKSSNLTVEERRIISHESLDPLCYSCPVGADCGQLLKPLPDYWGYKNHSDFIIMLRCPPDYCCTGDNTCEGIDSCNTGRTGTLCGTCQSNLTESLFSAKCLLFQECQNISIMAFYLLSIVGYSVMLLVSETIKNKVNDAFKKIYKLCKQRRHCPVQNGFSSKLQKITELLKEKTVGLDERKMKALGNNSSNLNSFKEEQVPGSGMKYIQVLFYYAQDASLFKVHLPGEGQQGRNIVVQILEFSPEVLVSIYVNTVDLCFSYGLTAVTKVLAKSVFGYCVMLFLLLLYLIHKSVSRFVCKYSDFWVTFRSRSIQAFLISVLFSFQKLVIGAFSLVQCVEILGRRVLYIEGDIVCYTWWQHLVQVYICVNVIPLLFIVSHAPFYVQDKTMSVKMFILNCLFPLPAFLFFTIRRLIDYKNSNTHTKGSIPQTPVNSVDHLSDTLEDQNETQINIDGETIHNGILSTKAFTSPENVVIPLIDEESSFDSEHYLRHRNTISENSSNPGYLSLNKKSLIDSGNQTNVRCSHDKCVQTNCPRNPVCVSSVKYTRNEEAILDALLKHYKCLQVRGIRFTWLGIHQAYRVILVVCNTYITEPLPKLWAMTTALMLIAVANTFMKPYQDDKANKTAILSYAANLCIAMINIFKTGLVTFSCKTNCSVVDTLLWYFSLCEKILLIYLPVGALVVWVIYVGIQKCRSKDKKK